MPARPAALEHRAHQAQGTSTVGEVTRLVRAFTRIDDPAARTVVLAIAELHAARERRSLAPKEAS